MHIILLNSKIIIFNFQLVKKLIINKPFRTSKNGIDTGIFKKFGGTGNNRGRDDKRIMRIKIESK